MHLITRGFRNFGLLRRWRKLKLWELQRHAAFTHQIHINGGTCHEYKPTYMTDAQKNWDREQRAMVAWLKQLPKPVAIMAAHDSQGVQLLDACRRSELRSSGRRGRWSRWTMIRSSAVSPARRSRVSIKTDRSSDLKLLRCSTA